ncbi:MAG: tetratricopeptide repeat protein [Candidatus Heimdallarchaeota archaeon]|nr:tetratricopeptide repeat protein [Candidatus Heimdallarchaeota archaeon]
MNSYSYKEALEKITQLEETPNISESDFAELMFRKSFILTHLGFFDDSISHAQHTLNLFGGKLISFTQKYDLYFVIIESLWRLGKFEESLLMIERVENYAKNAIIGEETTVMMEIETQIQFHKSCIYCFTDLKRSVEHVNKSLNLSEEVENEVLYARSLFRKGKILTYQGKLDESHEILDKSLEIGKKLNDHSIMANSLVALGEIHRLKGDFAQALQFFNTALILHQKIGNNYGMAITYNNVGIVYYSQGDYDNSFEYFTKSLERALEIDFKFTVVESLFYLINILLTRDDFFEAKEHLDISRNASIDQHDTMIYYYSQLSEAVYHKKANRFASLGKAQEILEYIISKNLVYQEINIHAMLNLCEILLHELRFTNNPEILEDLEEISNKLLNIAKEQISRSLLAEVYWLKGRLALVDADIDKSTGFLSQAQIIAEGQNLENLARKISSDHDAIITEYASWKNIIEENASLADRIKASQVDKLVLNMINRATFDLEEIENDAPVMLMILDDNGIPFFSYQFGDEDQVNQVIFSGFLTAINNIIQEVFSTEGSLRRIEHQNYLLIFSQVDNVIICYAFKGSSYSASKKMESFRSRLISSPIWLDFPQMIKTGRSLDDKKSKRLENWADEIFT